MLSSKILTATYRVARSSSCPALVSLAEYFHFHFHFGVVATEIHQNHINSFASKGSASPATLPRARPAAFWLSFDAVYHSRVTAKTFDGPSACFLTRQPLNVVVVVVVAVAFLPVALEQYLIFFFDAISFLLSFGPLLLLLRLPQEARLLARAFFLLLKSHSGSGMPHNLPHPPTPA